MDIDCKAYQLYILTLEVQPEDGLPFPVMAKVQPTSEVGMPMRRSYVVPMRWMVIYEYEVPGGGLNLNSTKLPRPWSPRGSSPSRKNLHGRTGNRTQDIMISSQKLWTLDHEAGRTSNVLNGKLVYKHRKQNFYCRKTFLHENTAYQKNLMCHDLMPIKNENPRGWYGFKSWCLLLSELGQISYSYK
jgi:hypothetical protein